MHRDQFEPLKISSPPQEHPVIREISPETISSHNSYFQPTATTSPIILQAPENYVTKHADQLFNIVGSGGGGGKLAAPVTTGNPQYVTVFPKPQQQHSVEISAYNHKPESFVTTPPVSGNLKTYQTKSPSSIFSPLLEKPKIKTKETPDSVIKEVYVKMNPEVLIAKDRQKFFQELLDEEKNQNEEPESADDQAVAQNDLGSLRSQFERELIQQLKEGGASSSSAASSNGLPDISVLSNLTGISEFSLPNGQKIQISKDYNKLLENDDGTNKIKAIVVKQLPTSTPKSNILDELTKGVVPPGAEVEVIRRNKNGALEEVGKLPQNIPQKKVTFVILEEQPDGTVKVQGVRGSEKDSLKESGEEVDSIIKKIEEGELKLPPSTRLSSKQSHKSTAEGTSKKSNRGGEPSEFKSKRKSNHHHSSESRPAGGGKRKEQQQSSSDTKYFIPTPVARQTYTTTQETPPKRDSSSFQYFSSPTTFYYDDDKYSVGNFISTTPSGEDGATNSNQLGSDSWSLTSQADYASDSFNPDSSTSKVADNLGLFHLNNSGYIASLFSALKTSALPIDSTGKPNLLFPFLPTTAGNRVLDPSERNNVSSKFVYDFLPNSLLQEEEKKETAYFKKKDRNASRKPNKKSKETRKDNEEEESNVEETKTEEYSQSSDNYTLSDVLKKEGFYAMARFLRQSGLDSILNDTGRYH